MCNPLAQPPEIRGCAGAVCYNDGISFNFYRRIIMNFPQIWSKAALLAIFTAAASLSSPLAAAQQAAPAAIAPPPPELQNLDEGEPPAVTIKKPGDGQGSGNSITERRDHGQTTEVKVKSGPSTYYVKPQQQLGSSTAGDAQSGPPSGAQWQVKEFDWGGSKQPNKPVDADSSGK
jgi:hypothetical protein